MAMVQPRSRNGVVVTVNVSCIECNKNIYITLSSKRGYNLISTPFHENKIVSP